MEFKLKFTITDPDGASDALDKAALSDLEKEVGVDLLDRYLEKWERGTLVFDTTRNTVRLEPIE